MRGLVLLALLFAMIVFMLPFIMGFAVIIVVSVAVLVLLTKLGLISGRDRTYHTYTYTSRRSSEHARPKNATPFDEDPIRAPEGDEDEVWYQSTQEGETITLPETALKKDEEK